MNGEVVYVCSGYLLGVYGVGCSVLYSWLILVVICLLVLLLVLLMCFVNLGKVVLLLLYKWWFGY